MYSTINNQNLGTIGLKLPEIIACQIKKILKPSVPEYRLIFIDCRAHGIWLILLQLEHTHKKYYVKLT